MLTERALREHDEGRPRSRSPRRRAKTEKMLDGVAAYLTEAGERTEFTDAIV